MSDIDPAMYESLEFQVLAGAVGDAEAHRMFAAEGLAGTTAVAREFEPALDAFARRMKVTGETEEEVYAALAKYGSGALYPIQAHSHMRVQSSREETK